MRLLQSIHHCDLMTFNWCLERKSRQFLIALSRVISRTADGYLFPITALLMLALSLYDQFMLLATALIIERIAYFVLKKHCRRNRPPQAIPGFQSIIEPSDQFSFPSGHTSAAFLLAGLLSHLYPGVSLILYPWAVLVGCSRVMLGVHFPTDTVAGALLGLSISILTLNGFGAL